MYIVAATDEANRGVAFFKGCRTVFKPAQEKALVTYRIVLTFILDYHQCKCDVYLTILQSV